MFIFVVRNIYTSSRFCDNFIALISKWPQTAIQPIDSQILISVKYGYSYVNDDDSKNETYLFEIKYQVHGLISKRKTWLFIYKCDWEQHSYSKTSVTNHPSQVSSIQSISKCCNACLKFIRYKHTSNSKFFIQSAIFHTIPNFKFQT